MQQSAEDAEASAERETRRLRALRATELLDALPDEAFDRYTRLASRLLGVPVSLVSLVDLDRQFFLSQVGLADKWATLREAPLTHSFCQIVVADDAPLVIPDAREDPRVADNLAIPDIGVVAYAGVPLRTADGFTLGSFCAIDAQPRTWADEEVATLEDLAAAVMGEVELRRALRAAQDREAQLYEAASGIRAMHATLDTADADQLEARRRAERAAAELAHELRTPLYAIRMVVEDLEAAAPPALLDDLGRIDTTARDALDVIEHQLELARAEAGRAVLRVADLQVAALFGALRGMLEPLARPGVDLHFDLEPGLPVLHTDGTKLTQVLRNLTSNALRHTDAGEVRVAADAHPDDRGVVRFTVSDTGIGIAAVDHERIFGAFEQVDGAARPGGTGLGLPLARAMTEMLGGTVTLRSERGTGSTFTVDLPAVLTPSEGREVVETRLRST